MVLHKGSRCLVNSAYAFAASNIYYFYDINHYIIQIII